MSRRTPAEAPRRRSPRLRVLRSLPATITAGLLVPLWLLFTAPAAQALPSACDIPGISEACDINDAVGAIADFASDPFGFIAKKMGEGAAWFLGKIIGLMDATTKVDFTNPGFLKTYALIFGVSTLLTLILWLVAVAKRVVSGISPVTAVSEAVGLLLLQVMVNAFTPAALVFLNQLVDEITKVFAGNAIQEGKAFIEKLTKVILKTDATQAPVVLIIVFLLIIVAALLVWIELLIRAGALYIGAALGPLVNAGLVDRDLWGKTKKWVGMLLALLLAKPVLFALFGLAAAIMNSDKSGNADAVNTILVGALLLFLSVFSSASIYKWLPGFGDEMGSLMNTRKAAGQAGPAAAVPGPAQAANSAMSARMTSSVVGKGTAAAGPVGAALTAVKAGVDMAKNKAQGADTIADQGGGEGGPQSGGSSTGGSSTGGSSTGGPGGGSGGEGAPSSAPSSSPTGGSVVPAGGEGAPGSEGGDSSSVPAAAGAGTANPVGSSTIPADHAAGGGGESSAASSPSASPNSPAGPSTIPLPAQPAGSPASPPAPSPAPSPAPAGAPASGGPAGTSSGAGPATVPTPSTPSTPSTPRAPSAPSTPAAPVRPIPGGSGS
ncbi:hypothetical protein [Streptomyces sp. NBC_01244]|uniref:hypothetical protein n=1 Tax=Streptomyces sp. NBC_01244 TaxID=2903797 RepID=UPI002E139F43|nr:hypothetical protein OG247_44255 [Streptomyces sp. NBC_01244]